MRIVYLADAPYIHTKRWVRHFAGLGHEVHVISFRPAEIDGATVHYVDGLERIGKARYLVHARRVSALVRSLKPDLLHALHLTSYGFLAGLSGVQPSIVSVWGTDILEAPSWTPAHRWITRHALTRAGAITATGVRLAEATLPHAPQGKPVTVIPYGIDLEIFSPRTEERAPGDVPVIGAVSRLSPENGLEYLRRAVALLCDRADRNYEPLLRLNVVLAGDGPSRESLEWLTAELRIDDRVRFLGEVPYERVPDVLRSFDIFAMPSLAEGFGVSALEASAMELPVIASDVHGIPDVVRDGHSGILTPPRDIEAIADAIVGLLSDSDRRRRMGTAGREYVRRHYQWRDNVRLMEALYQDITAQAASRETPGT
jgi:glycosyltransferase involved in cell wall biosynthesis